MVKAVEDVQGSLADAAAGEQVLEQMVAEQEHELGGIERRDRLKVAAGRPDSSACESVDMGMEIEAVAVALNGDDDAREGCRIRGDLLEHLPEGLPDRLAEQAEVAAVELENGAQELGNGEDELGVADLLEDVAVEPLGEKQDAFLLACGTEESAFTGIRKDRLVAAAAATKTREASVKVSTFQMLVHHLADDGAPDTCASPRR